MKLRFEDYFLFQFSWYKSKESKYPEEIYFEYAGCDDEL